MSEYGSGKIDGGKRSIVRKVNREEIDSRESRGIALDRLVRYSNQKPRFFPIQDLYSHRRASHSRSFIELPEGDYHWVLFCYERVFRICYTCGRIGHANSTCNYSLVDVLQSLTGSYEASSLKAFKNMDCHRTRRIWVLYEEEVANRELDDEFIITLDTPRSPSGEEYHSSSGHFPPVQGAIDSDCSSPPVFDTFSSFLSLAVSQIPLQEPSLFRNMMNLGFSLASNSVPVLHFAPQDPSPSQRPSVTQSSKPSPTLVSDSLVLSNVQEVLVSSNFQELLVPSHVQEVLLSSNVQKVFHRKAPEFNSSIATEDEEDAPTLDI
ncbi:hypothetical protein LOK49_LG12G02824 [Camellia lanceoleosa]|uniref:Uncharacterized protein n=1 Tax=Camellia lanceoleosa TaxID=1840588 RepID=A0ACC0FWY9_9ERIC|nr:hypothetical protein LOK49_LG12G02824 [Camellia lanceoleosa]